jgi:glyoxylase-like metal-dependent hydrolase (beta-lactamase superfamily II)
MSIGLERIDDGIWIDRGGGLAGVLRAGDRALVINPVNPGIAQRLRAAGIAHVDKVLFTHHRRELADGFAEIAEAFSPKIVVPRDERALFEEPAAYWQKDSSRWKLLCGHIPYHVTHTTPIPVDVAAAGGDRFEWEGFCIDVVATPGYTDGAVSYRVEREGVQTVFCGDLIYAPGRVRDVYCLQHGEVRNGHRVGDYHGFMGSMQTLLSSLDSLVAGGARVLVPAHGEVIRQPASAVALLRARAEAFYHAYVSISALRWYFPAYFERFAADDRTLSLQPTEALPDHVRILSGTTWALIAPNGRALLIDPYNQKSVEAADAALADGTVQGYDAIWLTHYHHDHVETAEVARKRFDVPIMTDRTMADVVAHPDRYFLTCLTPEAAEVACPTEDGQTWRWQNMTLTAYHFPGQTYYHSGLFVRPDEGPSLFFAGDAVTPLGIDDYCAWNRNWLGRGQGFDRCLRLLRDLQPDLIFNQHVNVGFRFSEHAYDLMLDNLDARWHLLGDMLPGDSPNFGTDEQWLSTYPYEQIIRCGEAGEVDLVVMNHADHGCDLRAELLVPAGAGIESRAMSARCEAGRENRLSLPLTVKPDAAPGRYVIPVRIEFDGRSLGTFREAIVSVARDR